VVASVVVRHTQYAEPAQVAASWVAQSIVPVEVFAHVEPGAHIVPADWVVSCRMVRVLLGVDTALVAVVAVAGGTVAAVAAAVAEGNYHHRSCTWAAVVCRTEMVVDVTSMLREGTHNLVVL